MKSPEDYTDDPDLKEIIRGVSLGRRITGEEGVVLYEKAGLPILSLLSDIVRRRHNADKVFFNRNFHIEPTNHCVHNCRFCSYHKPEGDPESWDYSHDEMLDMVRKFDGMEVTEVHITGGVHPSHDIGWYGELLKKIRLHRPGLHIKAYSAVELDGMITRSGMTTGQALSYLKECGLGSIPGGGAEIFHETIREKICPEKSTARRWMEIHETAHRSGIPSNATMLYGHLENYSHRIDHMSKLRELQDRTGGFNAFIPLKFRKANNPMSHLGETTMAEDLKNYAVSRIFLDNIPHIKAYWPMIGREVAQMSLMFGTDDLDGTIEDSTKIYSMAGSLEKNPAMSTNEICSLIRDAGFVPVERDSVYNFIHTFAL